jgi:transformation/transcription domain-associated protein
MTTTVPDSFVYAFENARPDDLEGLSKLLTTVVADLRELAESESYKDKTETTPRSVDRIISAFAHRFTHICHEEDWSRKMSGVAGLRGLLIDGEPLRRWIIDLEIDVVRALLYCLRDSPKESPQSSEEVVDMVKHFIKTCQSQDDGRHSKQQRLMDTLVSELNSPSKLARDSAHDFIVLLAEVNEKGISELVGSTAKAKLLDGPAGPIFNKPLRALPFPLQVGVIDAVTWLVELRPPVVDFSDEFIRLFHEVLALADVEDHALIGKPGLLKNEQWLKTLRISCIRLLRSSMATADFVDKPNLSQLRPRYVYKSLSADKH